MDQDQARAYREALTTASALKKSMEHALRSDPDAVWKHWAYRHYMRKYNDVVRYVQGLTALTAPIDLYDLDKVPHSGDTVMPVQKELFESVHANLSILEAWLSVGADLPAEKTEDLRHFLEANLRKAIFELPNHEREVQNAVEQLLIGRGLAKGIDYDRETGRVKLSIKESVPDFRKTVPASGVACGEKTWRCGVDSNRWINSDLPSVAATCLFSASFTDESPAEVRVTSLATEEMQKDPWSRRVGAY